ncbi:MAG: DNA polymerase I [candidate division Zixibacteria bacterium CG_4_9_14_3_um_filter_46_8]|nr:MAG: DNA polymerase I [candidate division Zixibacteria bacterium CG_4_9_14_3_um_filter_46_8]
MTPKLILVDGTALAYRSYFAFIARPLRSSKGEITSTSFGFINSINKLIRQHNPDHLIISFDMGAPTIRHKIYPEYKSTRARMPEEMIDTLPRLDEIAEAMNWPVIKMEGVEADDIIGTLALRGAAEGFDVLIYTGDKDFFQLVNDKITIISPGKKGEDDLILNREGVRIKFGVSPEKVIDVLSLMGDSSDNIPGVDGIGPKTAIQLIEKYGSFKNLYQSLDSIDRKKIKENLIQCKEQAELSHHLVTINTEIPLEVRWDDYRLGSPDYGKLLPLLRDLEFDRMASEMAMLAPPPESHGDIEYSRIASIKELKQLAERIRQKGHFAIDTETTSLNSRNAQLVGISISIEEKAAFYIPVGHKQSEHNLPINETVEIIGSLCRDENLLKIAQNLKYDLQVLINVGIDFGGKTFDTMLASYVLDPSAHQHGLSAMASKHFSYTMQEITELIGTGRNQKSFAEVPVDKAVFYSCEDADITLRLYHVLSAKLAENDLQSLFYDIEMPLVEVLRCMEATGVRVNPNKLREISANLGGELNRLSSEIYHLSGYEFNINSPAQMQKLLFVELQLPMKGRTAKKKEYSTDAAVLEELAELHPLPKLILEYRELTKVKSTYSDALVDLIDPKTSRIHTSFNQAVTATGRLSSADPNLQNIPVRTALGREVREAFVPTDDEHIFLSADYSQIELRLMAHIADDQAMIDSFLRDEDIHSRTAAEVYGVALKEVTPEMRRKAKVTNFAVIYGVSAYGLSRQVELSVRESADFIDIYFERYPGVRKFMDEAIRQAEANGYVSTIFGRRRYIPDIKSLNRQIREFSRRAAINTPIQGSAADIIKLAMIKIHAGIIEMRLKSRMVLQVHDELLFDVFLPELDVLRNIVKEGMENITHLKIPLKVEMGTGRNWLEAH